MLQVVNEVQVSQVEGQASHLYKLEFFHWLSGQVSEHMLVALTPKYGLQSVEITHFIEVMLA
jgi:hypothetical protein